MIINIIFLQLIIIICILSKEIIQNNNERISTSSFKQWLKIKLNTTKKEDIFENWLKQHSKKYDNNDEKKMRRSIFEYNRFVINKHNSNPERTYDMSIDGPFIDLTENEFRFKYLNNLKILNISHDSKKSIKKIKFTNININDVAESIDWRTKGAVTSIKNQPQYGCSCAFSVVAAIEGIYIIKKKGTNMTIDFSEQELITCVDDNDYKEGCMGSAFKYVQEMGIVDENFHMHTSCTRIKNKKKYDAKNANNKKKISKYLTIQKGNIIALKIALNQQPVSAAVDATSWQFYKNGIISLSPSSSSRNPNHTVLLVGYDLNGNWIIKNSWGINWGEQGYVRLQNGNTCGIANYASYPVL